MELETKNIQIGTSTLKSIERIAKTRNITKDKALSEVIEKGIETTENEIFEEKIKKISDSNDKITIQKPKKSGKSLKTEEIIGMFEAPEPFNSVDEVKNMESGENI